VELGTVETAIGPPCKLSCDFLYLAPAMTSEFSQALKLGKKEKPLSHGEHQIRNNQGICFSRPAQTRSFASIVPACRCAHQELFAGLHA
jgi:hypothetical protein